MIQSQRGLTPAGGLTPGLRFCLGLLLLLTAAGKLIDVRGFAGVLRTYETFPEAALLPVAVVVPVVELALAVWLFSGRRLAGAAAASVVLHALYATWAAASVLRGLRIPNCGCFGVFFARPLGWSTVIEDLVLTGLSVWLLVRVRRRA